MRKRVQLFHRSLGLIQERTVDHSLFEIREAKKIVVLGRNTPEFLVRPHFLDVSLNDGTVMPDRGNLAIFGCGDAVYHLIGVRDCLLRSRPMRESGS